MSGEATHGNKYRIKEIPSSGAWEGYNLKEYELYLGREKEPRHTVEDKKSATILRNLLNIELLVKENPDFITWVTKECTEKIQEYSGRSARIEDKLKYIHLMTIFETWRANDGE